MSGLLRPFILAIIALTAPLTLAMAGVPRGLRITADEQVADEASGTTIARGRAEILVERLNIRANADVIELRPSIDEILLKGSAQIDIGPSHFRSSALSCTLDFQHCVEVSADQPLPASASPIVEPVVDATRPR